MAKRRSNTDLQLPSNSSKFNEMDKSYSDSKAQNDLFSENIRLQNMSIFTSLKKKVEEIDSKNCQICKKHQKEILWFT